MGGVDDVEELARRLQGILYMAGGDPSARMMRYDALEFRI